MVTRLPRPKPMSARASRTRLDSPSSTGQADAVPSRDILTERKYVTMLRADLVRSSDLVFGLEVEESIARLRPALEAMYAAVHRYNGIIHQDLGDGVFAAFGAPLADDLHPVMACHSALEVVKRIRELGDPALHVRIGVHSGLVVAGMSEVDYRRMYNLGGPPLILAERLQAAAAADQVLASEACRRLAEGYIRFGPAELRTLKGFPEPVAVYPIEGPGENSKWRVSLARTIAPFVGRESETDRLASIAKAVEQGHQGSRVAVMGEPGVGKTRLVRETVTDLRSRGWSVIEVECNPILGEVPFALLRDLLRSAASTVGPEHAALPERPAAQAAALQMILRESDADVPPAWAGLTPRARARAIVGAARALLVRAISARPTVVLVEDLQWADEASADALDALVGLTAQHPLLFIASARPGGLPAWLDRHAPDMLPLRPLAPAGGQAMLDHLLGPSHSLTPLKERILAHTGALPLFIEEVCRSLAEAGALKGAWGAFEAALPTAELGVPPTVQGVIASRIDRLTPTEKRLLQMGAAIGPRVPEPLLRTLSGLTRTTFQRGLSALVAASMLVTAPATAGPSPANAFMFPHELVRQVAYDAVLSTDRIALHARILALLAGDTDVGSDAPDHLGALAHHALMAHEWQRAAEYATIIARQCVSKAAYPDAARHYETAMSALDRLEPSAEREGVCIDLRIEARSAYANFGKVSHWLDMAKQAESRANAIGDRRRRAVALAVHAAALNFCGTPGDAIEAGRAAAREASQINEEGWLGYAEYGLGQACYVAGRYREGVDILARAYQRFTAGGVAPPIGGSAKVAAQLCCVMSCMSLAAMGDYPSAAATQQQADAIAADEGSALAAIAAGLSGGVLALHLEQPGSAAERLGQSLSLAERHDVNLFVPVVACQYGLALLRLRRMAEAERTLLLARDAADGQGNRTAGLRAEIYAALCTIRDKRSYDTILITIQKNRQVARQQGYEPIELEALLVEAAVLGGAIVGDELGAARCLDAGRMLAERLGAAGTLAHMQRNLADLLAGDR
jgi:class 3 adenylate cyclase/tetratricopeptide (TPR) repeat protein